MQKMISNWSELHVAAADVLVWYQSCTAKQGKISHLCQKVCQIGRQTAGSRGSRATLWALVSSYPFMLSTTLSLSLLLSHSALFLFEQRHAVLFIGRWCFFICLCLFVVLRSTEGFLAADVSSAALQRDGWTVRQKEGKKGRQQGTKWQKGNTKERYEGVGRCMTFSCR